MNTNDTYTKSQIDKLGNTLIFLCEKMNPVNPLSKTHILKLIFIIEEISIKKFGIPFLDLRFLAWKLGPVSTILFSELTDEIVLLSDYISKSDTQKPNYTPLREFCNDEFSDVEIDLLNEVTDRFLYCTAKELINYTHKRNSAWYNTAKENNILEDLESGRIPITNIEIDLSKTIEDDEYKLSLYKSYKEFLQQSRLLKP
jgi:uncharacterized phage-associated protein